LIGLKSRIAVLSEGEPTMYARGRICCQLSGKLFSVRRIRVPIQLEAEGSAEFPPQLLRATGTLIALHVGERFLHAGVVRSLLDPLRESFRKRRGGDAAGGYSPEKVERPLLSKV
jgi:hypothetical protein